MSLCRHFEGDSHQRQVQTPEADLQAHLYYLPSAAEEATRRTRERHGGFLAANAKAVQSGAGENCRRRLLAGQSRVMLGCRPGAGFSSLINGQQHGNRAVGGARRVPRRAARSASKGDLQAHLFHLQQRLGIAARIIDRVMGMGSLS